MKLLLILGLLVIASTQVHAQVEYAYDSETLLYIKKEHRYKKMKFIGMALTASGVILTTVGYKKLSRSGDHYTDGVPEFIYGITLAGAGIPLWIIGAHAQTKYRNKLNGRGIQVSGINLNQKNVGITLKYNF